MPNMSYCRFENTAADLSECAQVFGESDTEEFRASLSDCEQKGFDNLLHSAASILAAASAADLDRIGIDPDLLDGLRGASF